MKVAHVSTFPGMKCGIAFFVSDLIDALPKLEHHKFALHYGENLTPDAKGSADVSNPTTLRDLARSINCSGCDVVSLQHEFGIWGGEHGEHIVPFLEEITLPIVTTLHTTFPRDSRPPIQTTLLDRLVSKSAITVVLTLRSKATLSALLHLPQDVLHVIPHGIPDLPFVPPPDPISKTGHLNRHLISFGFFRPDKGLDVVLQAVRVLRDTGIDCRYTIAGSPQSQFPEQKSYFQRIQALVSDLRLDECVELDGRFLTRAEQVQSIQTAHGAVFAYQDPAHASSGAVALALAAGRPVVCTPFEYAKAVGQEIRGVLVSRNFGAAALSESLSDFLKPGTDWARVATDVYERTRHWTWPRSAHAFAMAFAAART